MEDLSGRSFGPYRIVAPLGAGGMASVYKAYQPAVDRYVALKVLPRHLAQDHEFLARFQQEAKILASLQHPHILPVHDYGESDGFTYIVMPFIETGTLAEMINGQPLPLELIRRVIAQVGDALDCAHARGLVHRDVKPANILIDARGNCLLADFGIAKILEGADTLTAIGGIVGTPKYMSPEQGMGIALDGRSDLYSLGVVLYEMATGRVPFDAETPLAVVIKHIRDPLPLPSHVNPDIPDALERMILRAMHKEPSERFGSAAAMVELISTLASDSALEKERATTVLIGSPPPLPTAHVSPLSSAPAEPLTMPQRALSPSDRSPSSRHWLPVALAAAALVILVLLWIRVTAPESEARTARSLVASPIDEAPESETDQASRAGAVPQPDAGDRAVPEVAPPPAPPVSAVPTATATGATTGSATAPREATARAGAPVSPVGEPDLVALGAQP